MIMFKFQHEDNHFSRFSINRISAEHWKPVPLVKPGIEWSGILKADIRGNVLLMHWKHPPLFLSIGKNPPV